MIPLPANARVWFISLSDGWYSSIGNSEKLIGEVLHLRSQISEQWRKFSRRKLGSSSELLVNITQCLHRHCKKQKMCLQPTYSYQREHSGNPRTYLHSLLGKLMASVDISPDCLPSVILITLVRIKILQQFPSSLSKDKSQNCGPQVPRNCLKLLKEFNKSQPKVWKNIGDKIWPPSVCFRVWSLLTLVVLDQ